MTKKIYNILYNRKTKEIYNNNISMSAKECENEIQNKIDTFTRYPPSSTADKEIIKNNLDNIKKFTEMEKHFEPVEISIVVKRQSKIDKLEEVQANNGTKR